jgi:hypothetical protein
MTDSLTIITEPSEVIEIISPTNSVSRGLLKTLCEVEGCYHMADTDKLCKEHHTYISLNYLITHKPIQSPVAASKYSTEQRGLSCIQLHTDMEELQ